MFFEKLNTKKDFLLIKETVRLDYILKNSLVTMGRKKFKLSKKPKKLKKIFNLTNIWTKIFKKT